MTQQGPVTPRRQSVPLLLIAICLVGANMRISVYSIGPLLDLIARDDSISAASLGGLVSVPLLAWGFVSAFVQPLSARFGVFSTVLWSLVALAIGTVLRSLPLGVATIWFGTIVIGAALAVGNVLIPAVIRRDFSTRIPLVMSLYPGILAGVGAISAGLMVPIAGLTFNEEPLGWRFALLVTGLPIIPAVVAWLIAYWPSRGAKQASPAGATHPGPYAASSRGLLRDAWGSKLAWAMGVYMGVQSASFYILSTWISVISMSHGRSAVVAGFDVMIFQVSSILGSFLLSTLYRGRLQRWLPAALPVFMLIAAVGIIFIGGDVLLFAAAAAGLLAGLSLGVSLTLPLQHAADVAMAGMLSGMVQSIGYLLAAIGPVTFGLLYDLSDGWMLASVLLLVVGVVQFCCGLFVGQEHRSVARRAPSRSRMRSYASAAASGAVRRTSKLPIPVTIGA